MMLYCTSATRFDRYDVRKDTNSVGLSKVVISYWINITMISIRRQIIVRSINEFAMVITDRVWINSNRSLSKMPRLSLIMLLQ